MLVDLPGYGYAKVPAAVRKKWRPMIERYLAERNALKGVVLILDIRRMPDERERLFMAWLGQYRLPVVIVLTKADKLSTSAQARRYREIAETLDSGLFPPILFSAKTKRGKDLVWKSIENLIQHES